ncbi:MAG: class I SAM-dependent methyltransferase [Candidatus Helarchaeota archaeon]
MKQSFMENDLFNEREIQNLYDRASTSTFFMELDAIFGRSTENSNYRKKAISLLHLTPNSSLLEVACGIGYNFKIAQSYLQGRGRYVAIDISPHSLAVANGKIQAKRWTNIELINTSILRYNPPYKFDAILCTYANSLMEKVSIPAGIDFKRQVIPYLLSKFAIDYYESIYMDFCYILSGILK